MFPHHWFKRLWPLALLINGCQSTRHNDAPPTPIKADGQALTSRGENDEPAFSLDGQKILYVSSRRPQHKVSQVYELDLKSHKERRITFQNAPVHRPQYSPKGDAILYSSGTDELKERPPLLLQAKPASNFKGPAEYSQAAELYLHSLTGLQITRLTQWPGFDGEGKFWNPNTIVFTRRNDNDTWVMQLNLKAKAAHAWRDAGARSSQLTPFQDGKRFVWIDYAEDFHLSDVRLKDGIKLNTILADVTAIKKDPVWMPDGEGLLLSINHPDKEKFEIYYVKRDGSCLVALTKEGGRSENPAISPSGDAFLFVSNISGTRQIYIRAFPKKLECPPPSALTPQGPPATPTP